MLGHCSLFLRKITFLLSLGTIEWGGCLANTTFRSSRHFERDLFWIFNACCANECLHPDYYYYYYYHLHMKSLRGGANGMELDWQRYSD